MIWSRFRAAGESRTLLVASAGTIATSFYSQLLLIFSGPFVARMLGVEGRGYFAGLTLWPLLIGLLGNLGVPVATTYFISQRPHDARRIFGEACRFALFQIVALTLVLWGVLLWWTADKPIEVKEAARIAVLMMPCMLLQTYSLSILQSLRKFKAYNALRVLGPTLYTLSAAALFFRGSGSLRLVVVAWIVSGVVPALLSVVYALRAITPDWRPLPGFRRELASFALRGHLGSVSPVESLRLDQAIVAVVLSPAALGLYVVGYAFTYFPRIIAENAGRVALPMIARRLGSDEAPQMVWRFFWAVTLFNVPIAVGLLAAMPWLVRVFFGEEFAAATPIARVLLCGTMLVASRRILVEGLRGLGNPVASTVSELAMYPWLAVVTPLAMARFGAVGLAFSLSSAYALSLVVALWVAFRGATGSETRLTVRDRVTAAL